MPNKETLIKNIAHNKAKVQQLQQRIASDEKALEAMEAAEIKMLVNAIDATGLSTKAILKAIKHGDFATVEKLLNEKEEQEHERKQEIQQPVETDC